MKTAIIALWIVFTAATTTSAQQTDQQHAQMHKGSVKIRLGAALVAAGTLVVPISAAIQGPKRYGPHITGSTTGVGLMAIGGTLIWFGVQDQRKALQPQTTFGVIVGRRSEIQVRQSW